uniref:Translocon-associated protein subunit gamma n=1 Tax=Palpitomonas bilix TaxID=652834 RepID=A0A7S3G7B1_9EUKA
MSSDIPTTKFASASSPLHFGLNAVAMTAAPLYILWALFDVNPIEPTNAPFVAVGAAVSLVFLYLSYGNVATGVFNRLMVKRHDSVGPDVVKAAAEGKKEQKEEVKGKLIKGVQEASAAEAVNTSIVYNNVLFVAMFVLLCFYIFRNSADLM